MNTGNLLTPPQPVFASLAYRFLCVLLIPILIGSVFSANADHVSEADSIENAIALRQHDRLFDAIDMLKRLKELDPTNVRVNLELAVSHLKTRQFDEAEDDVADIYAVAPQMKNNKRLKKLCDMLDRSVKQAEAAKHQLSGEVTTYRGFDEITSEFPYFEITEYEDYYHVERKSDKVKSKFHYLAARLKGEYRYTPAEQFNLFGQPTTVFWRNRFTYFHKQTQGDNSIRFGFTSLDSSVFVLQKKKWALNARLKGKWHTYEGERTLNEQLLNLNGSVLFYGARIKLGLEHKKDHLNMTIADELFGQDNYLYEQNTSITTPYARLSYRFSDNLMWSIGTRKRNIKADNPLIEGTVTNYNTVLRYKASQAFELHLKYTQNDLSYDVVDVDNGLNSGEMKKTLTFGGGYTFDEHWQVGINALYVDKTFYDDFGQDQWKRIEGFVRYRF